MDKKLHQQPVSNKSIKWNTKPWLDLGTNSNGIPLDWLWNFFHQYVKKDGFKTLGYNFKNDRSIEHNTYFLNRNPLARPRSTINHPNIVRAIHHYDVYPKVKTKRT